MSVLSGLSKADFKIASDGLLELSEEKLRSIMHTEPITDVYHVEQTPFARGKFAQVRKIRHLVSGEEYAAKFIRKRRRAADTSREIRHEVAVLQLCAGCERIVTLHEVYETGTDVAIVLELCGGGELQRLLDESDRLPERCARLALRHALAGLAHLHARRLAHLDLKPQNLLLSADGDRLLICDFGISRAIQPGAHVREILGTRDYVAPEILSYEPLTLAADIWSVGVLAYVLLSGYSPFAGDTKQETYLNIAQCHLSFPRELFAGVSQRAVRFIRETLVVDPKGRLTVEECLEHPWLKDETDLPAQIFGVGFDGECVGSNDDADENDLTGVNGVGEPSAVNSVNGDHHSNVNGVHQSDENGAHHNDVNGAHHNDVNEIHHNDVNGVHHSDVNGVHHSDVNGVQHSEVYSCNGTNGTHEEENEERDSGSAGVACERDKPLKHGHGRDVSPPCPGAPSTPKVFRKSHPHPPSVLALCKKFQPDYEKPAKLSHGHGHGHGHGGECACAAWPARPPPDRAVLC